MVNKNLDPSHPRCLCCAVFLPDDLFLPQADQANDNNSSIRNDSLTCPVEAVSSPLETFRSLLEVKSLQLASRAASLSPDLVDSNQQDRVLVVVDTHHHAHLEREADSDIYHTTGNFESETLGSRYTENRSGDQVAVGGEQFDNGTGVLTVSLTCAVEPKDWSACLDYASHSIYRRAAIGVHPWYLADLPPDWLVDMEGLLQQHPTCMVGEIGLCKMARFVRSYPQGKQAALELQRDVFVQQLHLACRYQRPVSVHCVQQQGVLLSVLQALTNEVSDLPPAIALHSFTGTAHQVEQLLQWEASITGDPSIGTAHQKKDKRKKKKPPPEQTDIASSVAATASISSDGNRPSESQKSLSADSNAKRSPETKPLLYFGFSHSINYAMCSSEKSRNQGRAAVKAVPANRLLAESDVHHTKDVVGGTVGAVAYLAWALDELLPTVMQMTQQNGIRFLQTTLDTSCINKTNV